MKPYHVLTVLSLLPPGNDALCWVDYERYEVVLFFELRLIDVFNGFRSNIIMDHRLKRSSDGEPSGDSQRQRVEGQTSGGFASGEAGRHHLRFTGTATIHLNLDIESLFKEIEQRQGIATRRHKAPDQADPRKPCREVRLFGVNIADGPGRQQQEASSSRQQFGWQEEQSAFRRWEPKASRATQPHQETRSFPQQEVIDEQMSINTLSDSDNESNHEKTYHQTGSSHLMMHDAIISLDQISWHQIIQSKRDKAYDQAGPSRPRDARPARANKIEQLVTKLSESYGKNEHWKNISSNRGDIRYDIANAKMNKEEYDYAFKILKSTVKDLKMKRDSIRHSLKDNYTAKKR